MEYINVMRKKEVESLGYVLSSQFRRVIVMYLENPKDRKRSFSQIKRKVSDNIDKTVSDGNLNYYLTDLRAEGIIDKNFEKKLYFLTDFGDKMAKKIKDICLELK